MCFSKFWVESDRGPNKYMTTATTTTTTTTGAALDISISSENAELSKTKNSIE
jgi:hypothetical protein